MLCYNFFQLFFLVISKLNVQTLEIESTHRTNWRKQWSGNAFMACGVLYVLKKYDEKYTSLNYIYNTHTGIVAYLTVIRLLVQDILSNRKSV